MEGGEGRGWERVTNGPPRAPRGAPLPPPSHATPPQQTLQHVDPTTLNRQGNDVGTQ